MLDDDGVGYGDCLEQFTHLIFLKMADRASLGHSKPSRSRAGEGDGVYSCLSAHAPAGCRSPRASPASLRSAFS